MRARPVRVVLCLALAGAAGCLPAVAGSTDAVRAMRYHVAQQSAELSLPADCQGEGWHDFHPVLRPAAAPGLYWLCIDLPDTSALVRPALGFEGLRGGIQVFVEGEQVLNRPLPDSEAARYELFQVQNVVAPLPIGAAAGRALALVRSSGDARYVIADVRVGEESVLAARSFWMHADTVFAGGLAALLGAFALAFALIRPRRRSVFGAFSAFMFGIFLLCFAVSGVAGQQPQLRNLLAHAAYIALLLSPAALCRFQALLGGDAAPRTYWVLWRLHAALGGVGAIALLLFGFGVQRYFSPFFFVLLGVSIVAMIRFSLPDALAGHGGARIYAIALILFSLGVAYDALGGYLGWLPWRRYTFHYGVFALTLALGYMLERRMNTAGDALREYASGLESANRDLAALNRAFSRFVPAEFLHFLKKSSIVDVRLGDNVELELTIIVTDIHSFTAISEKMTPEQNFDFINSYFGKLAPVIRQNGGYIAKYTGDGLMGLFPRSPRDAIDAALAVQRHLVAYNDDRLRRGREPIHTGIGIHTGVVRLGTVGDGERMQGDVMGDAANLAARIEGLTRIYGAPIVMSERAYHAIESLEQYDHRMLDIVRVKGKREPVVAIELLSRDADPTADKKIATRSLFREGLSLYMQRQFPAACDRFQEVLNQNEQDAAARIYYDRSLSFAMYGPPADWEPVEALDQK
ncbi:MAG: adenylate/guanylate cyclase domain-containing protein [Leptospirales bacterium]|nr:adenylate/guanylate cyclase domain-containing protein [Leptospirales bacterium]